MGDEIKQLFEQFLQEKDVFKKAQILTILKRDKEVRIVEMAKHLNMKPSYISHILRLHKLPAMVVDGYYSKAISPTHLYVLARLQNHQQMQTAYEHVLANNLSVFDTEILVRTVLYGINSVGEYVSVDEVRVFMVQMKKIGVDAKIIQSRIRSKLVLEMKGDLLTSSVKLREMMKLLTKLKEETEKADFL